MGYETEAWRKPALEENDKELFSEHGRVLNNVCYRAYWLVLVKPEYGIETLLVKHGGGEERIPSHSFRYIRPILEKLSSDDRYMALFSVYKAYREGTNRGKEKEESRYVSAFLEGRLKKRSLPKQGKTRVWIENN